jgi:hypothetical protein
LRTKTLSHFAEIRKQLIWGNKFIMFRNKSLMFDNWINSDLIYINHILNENGEISQNIVKGYTKISSKAKNVTLKVAPSNVRSATFDIFLRHSIKIYLYHINTLDNLVRIG